MILTMKRFTAAAVMTMTMMTTSLVVVVEAQQNATSSSTSLPEELLAPAFEVSVSSVSINDPESGFEDIVTIHNGKVFSVHAGLSWGEAAFGKDIYFAPRYSILDAQPDSLLPRLETNTPCVVLFALSFLIIQSLTQRTRCCGRCS